MFPTCVGMNREGRAVKHAINSVPHVRGDEPRLGYIGNKRYVCSPRAWG